MKRPCRHTRHYSSGKTSLVNPEISPKIRKQVMSEEIEEILKALKNDGRVKVKGLGVFKIKKMPGKTKGSTYRDIKTGEMVKRKEAKPSKTKIKFFASKNVKEAL